METFSGEGNLLRHVLFFLSCWHCDPASVAKCYKYFIYNISIDYLYLWLEKHKIVTFFFFFFTCLLSVLVCRRSAGSFHDDRPATFIWLTWFYLMLSLVVSGSSCLLFNCQPTWCNISLTGRVYFMRLCEDLFAAARPAVAFCIRSGRRLPGLIDGLTCWRVETL